MMTRRTLERPQRVCTQPPPPQAPTHKVALREVARVLRLTGDPAARRAILTQAAEKPGVPLFLFCLSVAAGGPAAGPKGGGRGRDRWRQLVRPAQDPCVWGGGCELCPLSSDRWIF